MNDETMQRRKPSWRVRRLLSLCLALAGALVGTAALADPPGRVGRVAETQGSVWTLDDQQGEWIAADRNTPFVAGSRLSLQAGSRAIVQIGSATLRLDGNTEIEALQLDDGHVTLQLHGGSAALQLPVQDSAREFEIVTAEGRFLPQQRGHYRVDRRESASSATVWDGLLRFENADSQIDVARGQHSDFWFENGRTRMASAAMDRDAFTDWVVASERREGAIARRYVSPEMTGAYELDRYGSWDTHPEYGAVWYPSNVAPGWAPYRYGHWAWVIPWGWTWVDDAPWGFAPFHYGRWVNWGGRWCWAPGGYVARPVYAPALVAWFGGPNLSVSVGLGGGRPHLGWVALAPFEVFRPSYQVSPGYADRINAAPWRDMRGYRNGPPDDYANRRYDGALVVVPQSVLTEHRPIRPDMITPTPAQVQVWRGAGAPPVGRNDGVAIRLPGPMSPGGTTKNLGRDAVSFVPPSPARAAMAAPAQAPGSGRQVPWVGRGAPAAVQGRPSPAAPAVMATPQPQRPMPGAVMQGDRGQAGRMPSPSPSSTPSPVRERVDQEPMRQRAPAAAAPQRSPALQQAPQVQPAPTRQPERVQQPERLRQPESMHQPEATRQRERMQPSERVQQQPQQQRAPMQQPAARREVQREVQPREVQREMPRMQQPQPQPHQQQPMRRERDEERRGPGMMSR